MTKTIVTWDLGATKCTAGLVDYDPHSQHLTCQKHVTLKLAHTVSLQDLIDQLERGLDFSFHKADAICIGAAGHYDGENLLHANPYAYPMPFAHIAASRKWPVFSIIHDYSSILCATFSSYMEQPLNVKRLNTCELQKYGRRVALGIGTGLGLKDGVLLDDGEFWLGRNEIGHVGISSPPYAEKAAMDKHKELMLFLQKKYQHNKAVTFENILTGQGIANLYQFFHPDQEAMTPEQVGSLIREGKAPDVLNTFAWYFGLFVGTVQLTFMPEGGIWMTGGVALNHLEIFDQPDFFAGIEASPAYREQRETYPLGVLCNHEHALIGSGYYAVKRLL